MIIANKFVIIKFMKKIENLPKNISVFPLSNFILFPNTLVPLNIFEPRYIKMINDSMKTNRIIGMVQPKNKKKIPELYEIPAQWEERIEGVSRFKILNEINNNKLYRECEVSFDQYNKDMIETYNQIKFSDLELIFKNLKSLFKKKGYMINWKDFEKQSLDQTINTLAMASPFSLEEKQILLETIDVNNRKIQLEKILNTYIVDDFNNTTIQ